ARRDQGIAGPLQHVLGMLVALVRQRLPESEHERGQLSIPRGKELDRTRVVAMGGGVRVECERPVARPAECDPGARALGSVTAAAGELEGPQVMVCKHLGVVVQSTERREPRSGAFVLLGATATRYLAVRDVPNEDVPERKLVLVRDCGT